MKPIIFFDWDGTLADTAPLCVAHMIAVYEEMGLGPFDPAWEKLCCGPTHQESAVLLNIPRDRWEEYFALRPVKELESIKEHSHLFPGIRDMLNRLQAKAHLVIVSNGYPAYVNASLENAGITDLFFHAEGLKDGRSKAQALAELIARFEPEKAIMVGDRQGDFLAGKANGLPTLCACYGCDAPQEWALADMQAHTVKEMEEMLTDFLDQ